MPEAQSAAVEEGAPDAVEPVSLARMHRGREEVVREVVEGGQLVGGREAQLGSGDVEADRAAVAVPHGELGDLETATRVPHGGDQLPDPDGAAIGVHVIDALLEALLHRLDDLVEGQAALQVLLGRHPGEALAGLHHADRHVERGEVVGQRTGVGALLEPVAEVIGVGGGQLEPDLVGELDDRRRAEAAVEVVVERHLREGFERDVGAGHEAVVCAVAHAHKPRALRLRADIPVSPRMATRRGPRTMRGPS